MNESTPRSPVHVRKLGFLIHPDFGPPNAGKIRKKDRNLYRLLREHMEAMEEDELLLTFLTDSRASLERTSDAQSALYAPIRKFRSILHDRIVMVGGGFAVTNPKSEIHGPVFDRARQLAEAQGYAFDCSVESEAFGVALQTCVPPAAHFANLHFGLEKQTVIRARLTNAGVNPHFDPMEFMEGNGYDLQAKYRRIVFDCIQG